MAYSVRIKQFEGPLDPLLHLIERAELDIKDIFVSEITAQYLEYMQELDSLDMNTASEFLSMAATLLYIKSRQLLPRFPKEDEEEEDSEALLIRQLREYKAFKEASAELETLFVAARNSFTRLPEDVPLPPKDMVLNNASLDALYVAFLALLEQKKQETPQVVRSHHVRPDSYTVRDQMKRIRTILLDKPTAFFEDLFPVDAVRLEIIVTFMALLEMILHGEIILRQKAPFSPIRIAADKLLLEGDDDFDYMDEVIG